MSNDINALSRDTSRKRSKAFFHLKSASNLVDADSAPDRDINDAIELAERSIEHLREFVIERRVHNQKKNQEFTV